MTVTLTSLGGGSHLKAFAPIYLVESSELCWKCHSITPVITLASKGFEDLDEYYEDEEYEGEEYPDEYYIEEENEVRHFCIFCYIEEIPGKLENFLAKRFPFYKKSYSKSSNSSYFMNHCSCGAPLGDFYMHQEPEGAFSPTDTHQCKSMTLTVLKEEGHMELIANYSVSSLGNLILKHSKKQSLDDLKKRGRI